MAIPSADAGSIGDILKILEILAIFGTGATVVYKVGRMTEKFEQVSERQTDDISELKTAVAKLTDVRIELATQAQLFVEMRREINMLREGKGFIQPRVDGEYGSR